MKKMGPKYLLLMTFRDNPRESTPFEGQYDICIGIDFINQDLKSPPFDVRSIPREWDNMISK